MIKSRNTCSLSHRWFCEDFTNRKQPLAVEPAMFNLMTIFESVFWLFVSPRRKQLKRFMAEKCQVFPKRCSIASDVISGSRRLFTVAICGANLFSLTARSRHCWELACSWWMLSIRVASFCILQCRWLLIECMRFMRCAQMNCLENFSMSWVFKGSEDTEGYLEGTMKILLSDVERSKDSANTKFTYKG